MLSSAHQWLSQARPGGGAGPTVACVGGAAPCWGSLPGLGPRVAWVTSRPIVTGLSLTQYLGSDLVLNKCWWGGRAMMAPWNGLLLLSLFNGRLTGQIGEGFPWVMLSMAIWVIKILKHFPPVWFTASALSPQMPLLQRLPGSSPRTPWPCSEFSN